MTTSELPLLFPTPSPDGSDGRAGHQPGGPPGTDRTVLALAPGPGPGGLPVVAWCGPASAVAGAGAAAVVAAAGPGTALLPEMSTGRYGRPGLRGYRTGTPGGSGDAAPGRDWSTAFVPDGVAVDGDRLVLSATDPAAGLALTTEVESLPGGALRIRHRLTNTGADTGADTGSDTGSDGYVVAGLEVAVPVPDRATELLDSTGSHLHERTPQRHLAADGVWLRENRRGKTGLDAAAVLHAGTPGFDFGCGEVWAVQLAWSGNSVLAYERDPATGATLRAGELLLPGEVVLEPGASYETPWVHVVAVDDGLDGVAAAAHTWLRSLPAHPAEPVPVTLNVWEAVYFDHDLARLTELARVAAEVGVERFVLDDGWFGARRDDTAGLGDWVVSPAVWPDGLGPLVDVVRGLGMRFGLWVELEMVNPDSELFRAHPDWVLSTGGRLPLPQRHQQVLDLSRREVRAHLVDALSAVLSQAEVSFVKWDHNRDLLEAGSARVGGAPAVHAQTLGYYAVLDELRARFPAIAWESCGSGGGRVDLGVLSRAQRVWTSDMTDALARQSIQRWMLQTAAPEYLGAHVSAPVNHQTGRAFDLDFRAATALFGSFGIEWDVTSATAAERARLAAWVALYRDRRELLHSGRVFRRDTPDPAVAVHGVVAADASTALVAVVQLADSHPWTPVVVRVPGLAPDRGYRVGWGGPAPVEVPAGEDPAGPAGDAELTGALLAGVGVTVPRRRPGTVTLLDVRAGDTRARGARARGARA